MTCITITFGDRSENHAGMEKIGQAAIRGYNSEDLDSISNYFISKEIERIDLTQYLESDQYDGDKPELLIIRQAIDNHQAIYQELEHLEWDAKYFDTRRQRIK